MAEEMVWCAASAALKLEAPQSSSVDPRIPKRKVHDIKRVRACRDCFDWLKHQSCEKSEDFGNCQLDAGSFDLDSMRRGKPITDHQCDLRFDN